MDILIIFLFVYSLYLVDCNHMATTRQDGPINSYLGAEKTAKLLSFIQKIRDSQKKYPFRSGTEGKDEKNDTKDPSLIESMKLVQKNYDTGRKYYKDQSARRVNVQVISNPEVLDIYKQQSARRNGLENSTDKHHVGGVRVQIISNPEVLDAYRSMNARKNYEREIDLDRQRAYGEEVRQNSRLSMHILKDPEGALDFRRRHRKVQKKSKSTSDSTSESDNDEDISSVSSDSSDDEFRRSVVHFRVDEDLDATEEYNNSEDVTDVTLKPEEAFDIVKPFIVEIFNKLKEKNNKGKENDLKNDDDDDFYDPKKVASSISTSDENAKRIIKLNLRELTTKRPIRFWSKQKEPQDTDTDHQKNYNHLKITTETPSLLTFPTTTDIPDIYDSWRKKEKEKKTFGGENISAEKFQSREIRFKKLVDDSDWKTKKLPASKKSFVEPTLTHEDSWDDKGYGYWKKTNWEKEIENNSREKGTINKDIKREDSNKKNIKNDDKERKKSERSDEDWDKKDTKKDSWGNAKKKIDDWDSPKKKIDDWDTPKKKKDDWDAPKKGIDDWDKPKKNIDNWDQPKKKQDDWDSPKKKDEDWDKPKKKTDDWDTPKKKTDDWDKPKKKTDDWDSPKKKDEDWDKPKKKTDDWDTPKKKTDDWDAPKKKTDDWDAPKKGIDDWDSPKKKIDDWDKPKSKKNDWDKADNWNKKKDTKSEQKLPDNKNRDRGWDMVGVNDKKSGEKSYHKESYGNKKKSMYSEWGNYESFRNTKDTSKEKETYKEMKVEDYKDDVKPKKKGQDWDSLVPKISNNYDRPRKSKTYDSYERKPANSGFAGRTSIPQVGKKSIYAD